MHIVGVIVRGAREPILGSLRVMEIATLLIGLIISVLHGFLQCSDHNISDAWKPAS